MDGTWEEGIEDEKGARMEQETDGGVSIVIPTGWAVVLKGGRKNGWTDGQIFRYGYRD